MSHIFRYKGLSCTPAWLNGAEMFDAKLHMRLEFQAAPYSSLTLGKSVATDTKL